MKRKVLQYRFNMIEVMLAIVIIAIGMASTFVLFPVGLNANKQAMAENSISDLAEYITAFVRAESQDSAHITDNGDSTATYPFKNVASNYRSAAKVFAADDVHDFKEAIDVENPPAADWESTGGTTGVLMKHKSINGVYLVRQISGPSGNQIVDFSALAQIYLDVDSSSNKSGFDDEYFISVGTGTWTKYSAMPAATKPNIANFLLPLVLEISWPADVPIEEREKRYFRFELFNGQYQPLNDTAAP